MVSTKQEFNSNKYLHMRVRARAGHAVKLESGAMEDVSPCICKPLQ